MTHAPSGLRFFFFPSTQETTVFLGLPPFPSFPVAVPFPPLPSYDWQASRSFFPTQFMVCSATSLQGFNLPLRKSFSALLLLPQAQRSFFFSFWILLRCAGVIPACVPPLFLMNGRPLIAEKRQGTSSQSPMWLDLLFRDAADHPLDWLLLRRSRVVPPPNFPRSF